MGVKPPRPRSVEELVRLPDDGGQPFRRNLEQPRGVLQRARGVENAPALEIAARRDPVVGSEDPGPILSQSRFQLGWSPGEEQALFSVACRRGAVGIGRGVKAALGCAHVAVRVSQNLPRDPGVILRPCDLITLQVGQREQCVVVEHLLEVGNEPAVIRRVPVEASAYLVVHPSRRHLVQGQSRHAQESFIPRPAVVPQQEPNREVAWKLGAPCEAAVRGVESFAVGLCGVRQDVRPRQIRSNG